MNAYHQRNTSNFELINPMTAVLSEVECDITRFISKRVVHHPLLRAGYETIQTVIARNKVQSEPSHAMIIGDSGCGKTTLCDIIAKELCINEIEFQLGTQQHIPAILTSIRSPVTPKNLAKSLLRSMGDQSRLSGTADDLTQRLITQMASSQTKVVILDESQDLFTLGSAKQNGPNRELWSVLNWIKALINQTKVTFILMGLPNTVDLIHTDEQLARRFTTSFYLTPFENPEKSQDLALFADDLLLGLVIDDNYFEDTIEFSNDTDLAQRLYLATGGSPSRIKRLIVDAACLASQRNHKKIKLEHFIAIYKPMAEVLAMYSAAKNRNSAQQVPMETVCRGKAVNPFSLNTDELKALVIKSEIK